MWFEETVLRRTKAMAIEDLELIAIFDYFKLKYPKYVEHFAHIANESQRSVAQWNKLMRMGFKKGFSDIFISVPNKMYHGLFIELKSKRSNNAWGKPTKEQKEFIKNKSEIGYCAKVCYGFDDAKEAIDWYMKLN